MEVRLSGRLRHKRHDSPLVPWKDRHFVLFEGSRVLYYFRSKADLDRFVEESPGRPWREIEFAAGTVVRYYGGVLEIVHRRGAGRGSRVLPLRTEYITAERGSEGMLESWASTLIELANDPAALSMQPEDDDRTPCFTDGSSTTQKWSPAALNPFAWSSAGGAQTPQTRLSRQLSSRSLRIGDGGEVGRLWRAVHRGDVELVRDILERGVPCDQRSAQADGMRVLHAVAKGVRDGACDPSMIDVVLDFDADSAAVPYLGDLPLHVLLDKPALISRDAAGHNTDAEALYGLIRANPTALRTANRSGLLPIHQACAALDLVALQLLLAEAPITASSVDHRGWSPLHHALDPNGYGAHLLRAEPSSCVLRVAAMGELLRHSAASKTGASPAGFVDHKGNLPLHFAAEWPSAYLSTMIIGLYPDAITKANTYGELPLHVACRALREAADDAARASAASAAGGGNGDRTSRHAQEVPTPESRAATEQSELVLGYARTAATLMAQAPRTTQQRDCMGRSPLVYLGPELRRQVISTSKEVVRHEKAMAKSSGGRRVSGTTPIGRWFSSAGIGSGSGLFCAGIGRSRGTASSSAGAIDAAAFPLASRTGRSPVVAGAVGGGIAAVSARTPCRNSHVQVGPRSLAAARASMVRRATNECAGVQSPRQSPRQQQQQQQQAIQTLPHPRAAFSPSVSAAAKSSRLKSLKFVDTSGYMPSQRLLKYDTTAEILANARLIRERRAQIAELAEGVAEINDLVKEEAALETDYSENLGRIDQNATRTNVEVRSGVAHLRGAKAFASNPFKLTGGSADNELGGDMGSGGVFGGTGSAALRAMNPL